MKRKEKKRAREFKKGETHVYQYDAKNGTVTTLYGSDEEVRGVLEGLLEFFKGKCITTNIIESVFSACGVMVGFRGRRRRDGWLARLSAHFVIKDCPEIIPKILEDLPLTAYMGNKMLSTTNFVIGSQIVRDEVTTHRG